MPSPSEGTRPSISSPLLGLISNSPGAATSEPLLFLEGVLDLEVEGVFHRALADSDKAAAGDTAPVG